MWNLEQNDNYILSVDGSGFEAGEVVNCISFNKVKGKASADLLNVNGGTICFRKRIRTTCIGLLK